MPIKPPCQRQEDGESASCGSVFYSRRQSTLNVGIGCFFRMRGTRWLDTERLATGGRRNYLMAC